MSEERKQYAKNHLIAHILESNPDAYKNAWKRLAATVESRATGFENLADMASLTNTQNIRATIKAEALREVLEAMEVIESDMPE